MITLYQLSTSPFTEKVRRALNYKELEFEAHEVERAKVPGGAYAAVSATGKFPAIEHEGTSIWDSTDILEYLDLKFPNKPIIPTEPGARAMAHVIEEWADESLYFYEVTVRLAWEHNVDRVLPEFVRTNPHAAPEDIKARLLKNTDALARAQGVGRKPREQIVRDLERHFRALDDLLESGDWLVGSKLSSADLAVIAQVNALLYATEAQEIVGRSRHIDAWRRRVDAVAPK